MRKLALKDAFALARIVKAANIRAEIVQFANKIDKGNVKQNIDEIGLEFFVILISAVADEALEKKIYDFYANLKGVTAEEVSEYDFATVKADIKCLIEENDLKSFFNLVSALM